MVCMLLLLHAVFVGGRCPAVQDGTCESEAFGLAPFVTNSDGTTLLISHDCCGGREHGTKAGQGQYMQGDSHIERASVICSRKPPNMTRSSTVSGSVRQSAPLTVQAANVEHASTFQTNCIRQLHGSTLNSVLLHVAAGT